MTDLKYPDRNLLPFLNRKVAKQIAQKFAHVLQLNNSNSDTDLNSNACPLWALASVKAVKYQVLCYSMCVS